MESLPDEIASLVERYGLDRVIDEFVRLVTVRERTVTEMHGSVEVDMGRPMPEPIHYCYDCSTAYQGERCSCARWGVLGHEA